MTELDTLRPEVREAIELLDRVPNNAWAIVRTDYARLLRRNAELEAYADDMASQSCFAAAARAEEAEAELAALQARIDALMLEFCPEDMTEEQVAAWSARQRVVDEPQDDNAKEGRSRE